MDFSEAGDVFKIHFQRSLPSSGEDKKLGVPVFTAGIPQKWLLFECIRIFTNMHNNIYFFLQSMWGRKPLLSMQKVSQPARVFPDAKKLN